MDCGLLVHAPDLFVNPTLGWVFLRVADFGRMVPKAAVKFV
jgi:hypothetical protein